jgi:hypothetical protein
MTDGHSSRDGSPIGSGIATGFGIENVRMSNISARVFSNSLELFSRVAWNLAWISRGSTGLDILTEENF